MSRAQHYHVLVGLCGLYMPNENHVCRTRKEAHNAARELAEWYRDQGEEVRGSPMTGYFVGENECIEIASCDDARCLAQLD